MQYCVQYALDHCAADLDFLHEREVDEDKRKLKVERNDMPLRERLAFVIDNEFVRMTYTEAVEILHAEMVELSASVAAAYEFQSPGIVDVLEKLWNTFEDDRDALRRRPTRATPSRCW